MHLNTHNISSKIQLISKFFEIIFIGILFTSCSSHQSSRDALSGQANSPANLSNKRIQADPAKPFVASSLSQYLEDDPKSINNFISSSFNVFESRDSKLIEKLKFFWLSSKNNKFTIIHFGDSHVQMGLAQQITRDYLQASLGNGGRGLIFPYSIAKTYSQSDFITRFEGQWQYASSIQEYPKLPLGVSGFVARTSDPFASFTVSFKNQLPRGNNRIKLFYRVTSPNFSSTYYVDNEPKTVVLGISRDGLPRVDEFEVSNVIDTVRFDFTNSSNDLGDLEIYGLSIENADNSGVVYHNAGVGGAAYGAVKGQSFFESQVVSLEPSLYILDYGTNDILYNNKIPSNLESTVMATISRIRMHDPFSLILIVSPQNMYFKGKEITVAFDLAQLLRKISLENDCLYYDWFRIAGGGGAMSTWYSYGQARKDHIHLTDKGYALKGYLFAKAFENTVNDSNTAIETKAPLIEVGSEAARSVSMWLKNESKLQDEIDKNLETDEPLSIRAKISNLFKKPTSLWLEITKGYQLTNNNYLEVAKLMREYSASTKNLQDLINNASLYIPFVYQEVVTNKLPSEIILLPFLESGYNPRDAGGFKSSGLWGLMPIADKELGLEDNLFLQDRRDIVKSTKAALSLLKKLHNEFESWELALAAYNAGPGRIKKAIQDRLDSDAPSDYSNLDLQKETLDYVPKLIALRNIFNSPNLYGITLKVLPSESNLVQIEIKHDIDIDKLAKLLNLSLSQFYDLNPQYKKSFIPGVIKSKVLIPKANLKFFKVNKGKIDKSRCSFYAIRINQDMTVFEINKAYGLDLKTFNELNGTGKFQKIFSGSTIIIPKNRGFIGDIKLKVVKNSFIRYK